MSLFHSKSLALSGTNKHVPSSSALAGLFQFLIVIGIKSLTITPHCATNLVATTSGAVGLPSTATSSILNLSWSCNFLVGPRLLFFSRFLRSGGLKEERSPLLFLYR